MPKVSNIFGGSYQRASDINGPRDVIIGGWHEENLYGKQEYLLDLVGEFPLRLTATLARDISAALGEDDIDAWPDRAVRIYAAQLKIKDKDTGEEKLVDLIRAMKSERDKPHVKVLGSPPDDDIPF